MHKSLQVFSSVIATTAALLVGFKAIDFLSTDKCLDGGGEVLAGGACQFSDMDAMVLTPTTAETVFVIVFCVLIALFTQFGISAVVRYVLKNGVSHWCAR